MNARKEVEARFGVIKHEKEKARYLDASQGRKTIGLSGKNYPHKVVRCAGLGPSHVKIGCVFANAAKRSYQRLLKFERG